MAIPEDLLNQGTSIDISFAPAPPVCGDLYLNSGPKQPNIPPAGKFAIDHHPGPFDAVRLDYNILRNPARRAEHYLKCLAAFAKFGAGNLYRSRKINLGSPPDLSIVRADIDAVMQHWAAQGIEVGSSDALELDF